MDMKQIKELMAAMEKGGIKRMRIKEEKGYEIELERHEEYAPTPPVERHEPIHHFAPAVATPQRAISEEKAEEPVGSFVTSPMVGTFYSAPSPDDPSYVKVGDEVEEETLVCIIEAMKVMNEVKAGKKGRIAEILVDNSEPVEFGTKLFRII